MNNFILSDYIDPIICNNLIEYFKEQPSDAKHPGTIGSVKTGKKEINKEVKDSIDLSISPIMGKDYRIDNYAKALQKVLDKYSNKYIFSDTNASYEILDKVNLQYYPPGGGFHSWHCERGGASDKYVSSRHLVFMTYLNDIKDKGGTEFFYQNAKFKAEKGLTLIWPADWTHTHRGITSQTEEKYIITGWYNYK